MNAFMRSVFKNYTVGLLRKLKTGLCFVAQYITSNFYSKKVNRMKRIITLLSMLCIVAIANAQTIFFKGILQGSQQVPPVSTTASGVVVAKYDTVTNVVTLWGDYKGLSTSIIMSHIHGPAAPGSNAPVLIPLDNTGDTTGTLSGTATLTPEQETDMLNGLMYVNVHTSTHPDGEIRAQLTAVPAGQAAYFDARIQGAQQVPPNGSTAMGNAHVLVDETTDSLFLTGSFSGLAAPATMAHIHKNGLPGVSGPIAKDLIFSEAVSGVVQAADTVSADLITQMMQGLTYVNIHDSAYPDGEIRGQLVKPVGTYFLKAMLQGSQQVPPVASTAMGTIIVKYNAESNVLDLKGDYQGLSDTITMSHIHGPAGPGATAPVLIPLNNTGGSTGTLTGLDTLTDEQESDLLAGLMYVNVHTTPHPDGEIRGQLTVTSGNGYYMTGNLQGTQEVPPNPSPAIGKVTVLLDEATDSVYVTGNFFGLTDTATMGHIHRGPAGTNGPVVVPLSVNFNTYGTITGTGLVTPAFADSIIMGYSYVNIHTKTYPGGEIRTQLGNLVLPVKLVYFNGYKDGNAVSLTWQTAQEINLRSFEVEQQDASGNWVKRATIAASGRSNGSTYKTTDVPASHTGIVLYRLKMINTDGTFSYSPVISVVFTGSKVILSIVPNPVVNSQLVYTITGLSSEQKATVKVVDFTGKTLSTSTVSTLQNNRLNVGNLPAGLYKLVVNVNGTQLQKTFSKN